MSLFYGAQRLMVWPVWDLECKHIQLHKRDKIYWLCKSL